MLLSRKIAHYEILAASGNFAARITSPSTGTPASMRNSAWMIFDCRPADGKQPLDVGPGMTVTAVQLQAVAGTVAVSGRVLEREHQEPIRAQCSCERRDDALQVAEIHERVGRHDQVEGLRCCRAGTPSARLSSVRGRCSSPSRAPASLRTCPRRPAGAQKARQARRRVLFHIPRPARRDDAMAQGRNPPALPRRALARDTTASRASPRSSTQNCRRLSR